MNLQSLSKFDFVKLKAYLVGLYSSLMVSDECQLLSFLAQKDFIQTVPEATGVKYWEEKTLKETEFSRTLEVHKDMLFGNMKTG